jgi:homoserine kinase type II
MSLLPSDAAARLVLRHYPLGRDGSLESLGSRGGFSGAQLWRWSDGVATFCLRAWPDQGISSDRLELVLGWQRAARDAGLDFVPAIQATTNGERWVPFEGRLWHLETWMPGRADSRGQPTSRRVKEACRVLAQLHLVWQRGRAPTPAICPAVVRRLRFLSDWRIPPRQVNDSAAVQRALRLLPRWIERLPQQLQAWTQRLTSVQPCLCDPWREHFLYEGDRLTGLIDFGALRLDAPAVDLARALGSLVEDDAEGWRIGLEAYRSVRPFSATEEGLARALDRSGTVLGAANWLLRLQSPDVERAAAEERLITLLARLERWDSFSAHQ